MTRFAPSFSALAAILALLSGTPAAAQNAKSWVSATGNDGNDCTLAHPCATLQRAHDRTNSGGEIGVLTPGDYCGAHTFGFPCLIIGKSVHVTNDGTGEAGILALPTATAIQIAAGNGDIVSLRGLVIDGQVGGFIGIHFNSGAALHVQNCIVKNFNAPNAFGLMFEPFGNSQLFVSDSLIVNNGGNALSGGGIEIMPNGAVGNANVVLDRLHVENNVDGIRIDGTFSPSLGAHVIVRDSVFSGNTASGIHAVTTSGHGPAFAVVERSSMVNNLQNGVLADGPRATMLLKRNAISRNGTGMGTANGGQLCSYGNNANDNNGSAGASTACSMLLSQM